MTHNITLYIECHYAECRYAKCRGAYNRTVIITVYLKEQQQQKILMNELQTH
jgi:hypothetical protein